MNAVEERLDFPIAPPQGVTAYLFLRYIYFAPDQTMQPIGGDLIASAQQRNSATIIGAPDVDNKTFHFCLFVPLPRLRKRAALGSAIYPLRVAFTQSRHILGGLRLQSGQTLVLKSAPNFFLPQSVIAFHRVLQPMLAWRRKGGHDSQTQTMTNYSADGIRVLMRSLKAIVVVELRIVGQAHCAPVLQQGLQRHFGVIRRPRKRGCQTAMQRYDIKDFDLSFTANEKSLDEITKVYFSTTIDNRGQVPAFWRRWPSYAAAVVERATPLEDTPDSSQRRYSTQITSLQLAQNCKRAKFTKRTLLSKFAAKSQYQFFRCVVAAISYSLWRARPVSKASSVESLAPGSLNPPCHRVPSDSKLSRDLPDRMTAPRQRHHFPPSFFQIVFWLMLLVPVSSFRLFYWPRGADT